VEQLSRAEYNVRIRELPSSERPRERLRDHGAGALTTSELLAIVLRTGWAKQSVLRLADSLLARAAGLGPGGLGNLARLSFAELKSVKGLGEAKAAELQAVFELARRLNALQPEERPYVRSPQDVHNLLGPEMAVLDQEHLRVLMLNTRNQLMGIADVYKGNVNSAVVRTSVVYRDAVRRNAPCIIVVHNHPSGDPLPSPEDIGLTKQLVAAGRHLDIELLDHIVIGDKRYASLKQLGQLGT
jgi:DNA repair protein RadC